MAAPSEKLAESLEVLKTLQENGRISIRSVDLSRVHRERLVDKGYLQEVMKGWYIPTRPDEIAGESTAWYTSFWHFCAGYLETRFGQSWSLSPEQSIKLQVGNRTVPLQLYVRSPNANNKITNLLHGTSIVEIKSSLVQKAEIIIDPDGLRLFSIPSSLVNCAEDFYRRNSTDARAALGMIRDASELLSPLLEGGHSIVAGRIAGAFRNIGRDRIAEEIIKSMRAADYDVRENDPFEAKSPVIISSRERSPYVHRIRLMWQSMREPILSVFPASTGLPKDPDAYLKQTADTYLQDAYNSLSIEGYKVSAELIERVRHGNWNPENEENDRNHKNAMAARGYWQAYQAVQASLKDILKGENAGVIVDRDHSTWYRELFAPSVTAGILKAPDLAGYRNIPIYIRRSMHVPPNVDAVRDIMPVFFELLMEEQEPAVRIVLGHFVFVYIHPYVDGNGRIGRFLMNAMLASGGFPWTVVPLAQRDRYMNALEIASTQQDILPFAAFISDLVKATGR
jgi:Fic/DOC family